MRTKKRETIDRIEVVFSPDEFDKAIEFIEKQGYSYVETVHQKYTNSFRYKKTSVMIGEKPHEIAAGQGAV